MEFIEAIQRYQSGIDREIIKRIRHAMNTDFLSYKKRGGTAAFEQPEMFIAFRCMRLIGGRLATVKYSLSDADWYDPMDVIRLLECDIRTL